MKILIFSFTFPPQVGGVAEVARTQAAGFAARGHEVTVATAFDARRVKEHAPSGVIVRQFEVTTDRNLLFLDAPRLEGEWKIIREDIKSPAELYNLKSDPLEANNLASKEPERLQKMTAALDAHLAAAQLVPWQQPKK